MVVRIWWGRIYPGSWPSIEEAYRKLNEMPVRGMLGRFVTQDINDTESMYTITLWDDLASVHAWEASSDFKDIFLAAVGRFAAGSASISLCEVKAFDLAGLAALVGRSPQSPA